MKSVSPKKYGQSCAPRRHVRTKKTYLRPTISRKTRESTSSVDNISSWEKTGRAALYGELEDAAILCRRVRKVLSVQRTASLVCRRSRKTPDFSYASQRHQVTGTILQRHLAVETNSGIYTDSCVGKFKCNSPNWREQCVLPPGIPVVPRNIRYTKL